MFSKLKQSGWLIGLAGSRFAVPDPGFPVGGGRGPRRKGVDSWGGYVLKILYVKMKESGPLGGREPGTPPSDPPMICNGINYNFGILCTVLAS